MSVVIVTGANSGFGFHGCLAFARNGDSVVAAVRDESRASQLLSVADREKLDIHVQELDITLDDSFEPFVNSVMERFGRIDVLVNNAGILRPGSLEDTTAAALRKVMETNCVGPLLLTRAVLPHMRRQHQGHIIMMSSLSGIAGLPGDVTYSASKFGLEGAAEALRHEVDRWGIRVSLVEAGMYRTQIFGSGEPRLPADYPDDSAYRSLIQDRLQAVAARMDEAFDPAEVGQLIVEIANSSENRLRWPADPVAERVLATMFAHTDEERDEFLRDVADAQWWSEGRNAPKGEQ